MQGIAIDITEVGRCPSDENNNGTRHSVQLIVPADVQSQRFKRCKISMDEEGFHCGKNIINGNIAVNLADLTYFDGKLGSENPFWSLLKT